MASVTSNVQRYAQFTILLLAAGSIYPLLYLRQNFETAILETFAISTAELGEYYSLLGVMFIVTYLPSGWLADRVSPRWLVSFSMAATGLLGLWFYTVPSQEALTYIYLGWGLSSGLTFWAALIKAVNLLARKEEQGRFYGILEGCRGLVEALLATAAVALFAYYVNTVGEDTSRALPKVIMLYVGNCFVMAILCLCFLRLDRHDREDDGARSEQNEGQGNVVKDLLLLASIPEIWLVAVIILTGYQLFWATYSFSAFLQEGFGMTAVAAAVVTVIKLWMRPVGGICAGFFGDRLGKENVLATTLSLSSLSLLLLIVVPAASGQYLVLGIVLCIGVLTYATRGLYWSILDNCNVSERTTGLAIGVISLIAYTPDIYLPLLNGYIAERYEGRAVYEIYFGYIGLSGFVGVIAALMLKALGGRRRESGARADRPEVAA